MAPQSGVNRLLVVGSSVTEGRPETIGGANVLMGKLLDHLKARPDIDFLFVKANRYPSAVRSLLSVLFKAWSSRSQWDLVFVNVSQRGLALLFPLLALLSALLGKKWAMRAFGADALEVLENTPWKRLLKWCVKRSLGWKPMRWSKTFRDIRSRPTGSPMCRMKLRTLFQSKDVPKALCLHCSCQAIEAFWTPCAPLSFWVPIHL